MGRFVAKKQVWRYVSNPAAGFEKYEELVFDEEKALDAFFRGEHVASSINAGSIMRAVEGYQQSDETHKIVMIKEQAGEYSWRKIKRGKMRILVHEDSAGELYVHVYPRKDWHYSAA